MTQRILENLSRQYQALKVLNHLQEEEFTHLKEFRPQSVGALEFSIHELMRQLMVERQDVRRMVREVNPGAARLADLSELFGEQWGKAQALLDQIDRLEQVCAKQAEKSYTLALALYDQSSGYVDFFKDKLTPVKHSYGRQGVFAKTKPAPAMLRGAL
ncbi:flagellar export chaperone FlgN [Fundidesulfovibrio terrae]|uniref:flagellar export chaperone FlgN n=1 Tax=Fundidesulfovibrio terrae TaxID=2922866 RepID=UPI001FAFE9EB|nr:flagellar export chaperone FlgN [Fundidesulfovibrio terrae]